MKTPRDFGATGDGVTDDSAPLQKWLDAIPAEGGKGRLDGYYRHDSTLVVPSDAVIEGMGRDQCGLRSPLTTTPKMLGFGGRSVSFLDMSFLGDPGAPIGPGVGCYDFDGWDGITFARCLFRGHRHFVLVLSNNRNVRLHDLIIDDWGVGEPYTGEPGGREAGTAIFCWRPNFDMEVLRCSLSNGYGGGLWFDSGGEGLLVEDIIVDGAGEFGLVGLPRGAMVRRCQWRHIRRYNVSGHGCEVHGSDFDYIDNEAYDCDGAGHYFTDVQQARIEGNRASLCNRGDPKYLAMSGSYIFRTATSDPGQATRDVSFRGNTATFDERDQHALSVVNFSGKKDIVVRDFRSADNEWGDGWKGGAVGHYDSSQ